MCSSVSLNTFILLETITTIYICGTLFTLHNWKYVTSKQYSLCPQSPPSPWQPLFSILSVWDCPSCTFHPGVIIQNGSSRVRLIPLSVTSPGPSVRLQVSARPSQWDGVRAAVILLIPYPSVRRDHASSVHGPCPLAAAARHTVLNVGGQIRVQAAALGRLVSTPRRGIAGSYGHSVYLSEEPPAVFHSSCSVLGSYQPCLSF